MPFHSFHVPADDRSAERACSVEGSIIRQGLEQDGNHSPLRRFSIHSCQNRNLLRRSQKRGEERRGKRSPRVIDGLVLLKNGTGITSGVPNSATRNAQR